MKFGIFLLTGMAVLLCSTALAEEGLNILYLTKSAGFEHSVVKRDGDALSHSEKIMTYVVEKMGGKVLCTKDASLVTAEFLNDFDVVIFCTTGMLTTTEGDGSPAMTQEGHDALLAWIKAGGGFVGYHNANDTFHSKGDEVSPFVQMIGGEFETHGKQFVGTLKVVDKRHKAIASLPDGFSIKDEWYISRNLNKENMHVLALLQPGDERKKQEKYNIPDYPIIWCLGYGEGRVLYNALGHREEVWADETFQKVIAENINWAAKKTKGSIKPNYDKVVPDSIEAPKKKRSAGSRAKSY